MPFKIDGESDAGEFKVVDVVYEEVVLIFDEEVYKDVTVVE